MTIHSPNNQDAILLTASLYQVGANYYPTRGGVILRHIIWIVEIVGSIDLVVIYVLEVKSPLDHTLKTSISSPYLLSGLVAEENIIGVELLTGQKPFENNGSLLPLVRLTSRDQSLLYGR